VRPKETIRIAIAILAILCLYITFLLGTGNVLAASINHLSKAPSLTPSPTATAASTNAAHPTISLDPAVWAALIGFVSAIIVALISGAFIIYQIRRTAQIELKRQEDQFRHEQEMERLRKELEAQYKAKEQQEQNEAAKAEALRLQMVLAQTNTERAEAYRQALHADPRVSRLQILDMSHPLEVTSIYVKVRVHQDARSSYELDPTIRAAELQHDPNALLQAGIKYMERRTDSAMDPDEAIRKYKRCVFIGDPGAGKTTLLKYLALRSADDQLDQLPDVPIRIELNAFASSGHHDLLDFAAAEWDERYGFPQTDARNYMDENLQKGHALVLLDALDETAVGETPEAADASYQRVADAIMLVAARYHQAPVVVTARKAGYHQRSPLTGFTELEVLDFSSDDIRQFVTNWFNCHQDPQKRANGDDLNKKLERNPRMQALAANPLLLSLIVLVYEAQLDLPERRAELYKRCVEVLLTEWDAKRNIRRRREFKPEHKRQLLTEVAWHFHRQGKRYFPEKELLDVIAEFLPKVRRQLEENGQILAEVANEQGLLKEQARGWQGFLHLTLQEYFVAQYMTDHQQLDVLLAHRGDPWWEEVLLLYAGYTPDASPLLLRLIGHESEGGLPEDIFCTNLVLAGRCLAARPTVQQISLWQVVIDRLFEVLLSTPYPLIQEHIAEDLAAIGGVEVNNHLLQLLTNEQISVSVRVGIASALGEVGEKSVAGELVRLLANEQVNGDVRGRIASALGELGEKSIAAELVQLLASEQIHWYVRWSIANALGKLGEKSVAGDLVQLLANEQVSWDVHEMFAAALGKLAEKSIARELVQLLANEQISGEMRGRIADALGKLGEKSVARELVQLLANEQISEAVRVKIANALGQLGEKSIAGDLVQLLANEQISEAVRGWIAYALGQLGEKSVAKDLVQLLANEQISEHVRGSIVDALGQLGERSVAAELVQLLANKQIRGEMRGNIAYALGKLGEKSVAAELVQMLANEQTSNHVRIKIADALGELGEKSVARDLIQLLANEQIRLGVGGSIVDALGELGEKSVAAELVHLLANEQIFWYVRERIASVLGQLGEKSVVAELIQMLANEQISENLGENIAKTIETLAYDESIVRSLAELLPNSDIAETIHSVLWTLSRRFGVRIFMVDGADGKRIKVAKWG